MENLKIKVNNEAESKEVQELFNKLNLDCDSWSSKMNLPFFICNWIDGEYSNYSLQDSGLNHLNESSIQQLRDMVALKRNDDKTEAFETKEMCGGGSKPKHSHYKKDVSHLNVIDPYRIADLYDLHPCADHIMKKSLCAGKRGHKDLLRDIQDIIDTAERWKEMIEEDNREV